MTPPRIMESSSVADEQFGIVERGGLHNIVVAQERDGRFAATLGLGDSDGPWIVEAYLATQDSGPVIGELRIFPKDMSGEQRKRGSRRQRSRKGVPPGGLTKKFLNSIPIARIQSTLRVIAENMHLNDLGEDWQKLFPKEKERQDEVVRPKLGRPPVRPLLFYAKVARAYHAAFRRGSPNPTAVVQRKLRLPSREQARDAVKRARIEGLLTPAPRPGFPGGQLTPKAQALLDQKMKGKIDGRQRSTTKAR